MAQKITVSVKKARKPFWKIIGEMIGRIEPEDQIINVTTSFDLYKNVPTMDASKVDYNLTKAIYFASTIKANSKIYGKEYIFGATFGKPIINAITAFTIGKLPIILLDSKNRKTKEKKSQSLLDLQEDINDWLEENSDDIFTLVRNDFRDGDSYVELLDDTTLDLLPAETIEKVVDVVTGKILGFNVTNIVEKKDDKGVKQTTKYVTKYRTTAPYKEVTKFEGTDSVGVVQAEYTIDDAKLTTLYSEKFVTALAGIFPLPIIGFHNEREPRAMYGNSEYQSVYTLMANYHAVLESAIKNNIYNSNAVPVLGGIANFDEFLKANGELDEETGEYELNWGTDKVMLGGEGFSAKMLEGIKTAEEANTLLGLLFWLICQSSETPEFVMGTAVSSSKASVSEQMPVMLRKAERKQRQINKPLKQLIELYIAKKRVLDPSTTKEEVKLKIKWLPVLDKDLKVNSEIVKILSTEGCITDKTKLIMCGITDYVTDVETEIEDAHAEGDAKSKKSFDEMVATAKVQVKDPANPNSPQAKTKQSDELKSKKVVKVPVAK